MPIVHVSLSDRWASEEARAISEAVHQALVECFRIPDHDHNHTIDRRGEEAWAMPPRRSWRFVQVQMQIFPGRSIQAKKALYERISQLLSPLGVPSGEVMVVLQEIPLENWGIGGKPASEMDLGFSLSV